MQKLRQVSLFIAAVAVFATAFFILAWTGLPNRADYSGQDFGLLGYAAPEIGAIAPPFTLQNLTGEATELISLRGEPIIINFWATWCVPCAVEMPELQALHDDTGVRILAINIGEDAETIRSWVESYGLSFDILLDVEQEIYALYRLRGQPTTFVLDEDGIIREIFYGASNAATLRAVLDSLENG